MNQRACCALLPASADRTRSAPLGRHCRCSGLQQALANGFAAARHRRRIAEKQVCEVDAQHVGIEFEGELGKVLLRVNFSDALRLS